MMMKEQQIVTGSSMLPEKKSVFGNLLQTAARELISILVMWGLKKLRGARPGSPGATGRLDFPSQERPGALRSSPQEE